MPKKPVKMIIKFSNNSTTKEKPKEPEKSGPSEGDRNGDSKPPRKLRP